MPNMVTIAGASVDADDPCALYQALYAVKLKLLAGEQMEEIEIRSPVNQRRLRVAVANMKAIDDELMRLATACAAKNGAGRVRYAKRIRFTRC
jgi:hypothetical protein